MSRFKSLICLVGSLFRYPNLTDAALAWHTSCVLFLSHLAMLSIGPLKLSSWSSCSVCRFDSYLKWKSRQLSGCNFHGVSFVVLTVDSFVAIPSVRKVAFTKS